jgi:hypothetical protein
MGGKCIKDIKVINVVQQTNNVSAMSNKSEMKPVENKGVKSSGKVTSSQSMKSKEGNSIDNNKISIQSDILINPIQVTNVRKNSKKNKILNENLISNESQVLKVIKKHNRECDDAKLIDSCLTKHFFMRVLDKLSR